jgi:hypothetical protein
VQAIGRLDCALFRQQKASASNQVCLFLEFRTFFFLTLFFLRKPLVNLVAAFRILFLTIFFATVGVIGRFIFYSRSALAKIPQHEDFVDFTDVTYLLYVSKNLICFFVIMGYVHLLALMQELPEFGGHVSAILYTITDTRVLVRSIFNS